MTHSFPTRRSSDRDMSARAAQYGRKIDFGLRVHVIVRENEEDARAYTKTLMSTFDAEMGEKLKHRAQDSKSAGVLWQDTLRITADADYFVAWILWTGIRRVWSGYGADMVRASDMKFKKLNR